MKPRHWFLPDAPDLLAMLASQATTSVECLDALVAWAHGDAAAPDRLRVVEDRAGACKHELWRTLRSVFSCPIDAEDLFSLSHLLDEVLNGAHDLVREAEVLGLDPVDAASAQMATWVRDGVARLGEAFQVVVDDPRRATELADRARHEVRQIGHGYREAMQRVLALDDPRAVWAEAQRYAHFIDLANRVVRVSDRVWYAVVKEA